MKSKIICKHKYCWKSALTADSSNLQVYAYFDPDKQGKYPILYEGIFVLRAPKERTLKDLRTLFETAFSTSPVYGWKKFIRDWESDGYRDLIYHLSAMCEDKKESKKLSLYYMLYVYLKEYVASASFRDFSKISDGNEEVCFTSHDLEKYRKVTSELQESNGMYAVIFPEGLDDYKDYTSDCSGRDHPLKDIFLENLEIEDFAILLEAVMERPDALKKVIQHLKEHTPAILTKGFLIAKGWYEKMA